MATSEMNPEKSNDSSNRGEPEILPGCSEAVQPQRSSGSAREGLPAGAEQLPRGILW